MISARRRGEFPAGVPRGLPGGREAALYRRVYDVMRRAIADGAWALGESLPSEAGLGARFGVSRITIRQAMQMLQNAGYIRTQRARRAVVIARDPLGASGDTIDTIEELIEAASDTRLRILSWRSELAPDEPGYRLMLARFLAEAGLKDQAQAELSRLEQQPLRPEMRAAVRTLRTRM